MVCGGGDMISMMNNLKKYNHLETSDLFILVLRGKLVL